MALERVGVVEETGAALLAGWTLEKTDMVREPDQSHAMVERLNADFVSVCERVFGQAA